ncbi:unnamed protein product [Scytosiphon promiscuus]
MSQARKIYPIAGAAAAAGAAGVWAWRRRTPAAGILESSQKAAESDEPTPAPSPSPTPPPDAQMQRTGPMVAVYLDKDSVQKLEREYPGTKPGRLRKVVIQYNPSIDQRGLYAAHFGGSATVKLTGEASTENRLALMASVSSDGTVVEPESLPCAVDVTPGDVGGGPLGSTVLIEQIKRAGALTQESWKGQLPALSAHERDFSNEEGSYHKLDEPFTLTGSICRADWVEGESGRCRTTTAEGEKRKDGWTPQGCIICNTLEASPCRDIYKRFDSLAARINELEPKSPPEGSSSEGSSEESSAKAPEGDTDAAGRGEDLTKADEKEPARERQDSSLVEGSSPAREGEVASEGGEGDGKELKRTEEEKLPLAEIEILKNRRDSVMMEMLMCSQFHHVFEDSNADDGLVPDMPGDDDEAGDGATRSEAVINSEAGGGGEQAGDGRPQGAVGNRTEAVDGSAQK